MNLGTKKKHPELRPWVSWLYRQSVHCTRKKEAVESISPATSTLVLAPSVAGWTELCMQSVVARDGTDLADSASSFGSNDQSADNSTDRTVPIPGNYELYVFCS